MNPTLSWERVGGAFYRNVEGYNLEWDINLAECHVRVSSGGGIVAAWDRSDVIRQNKARHQIQIYSGSGKALLTLPWDGGAILDAGFTLDENFVIVSKSGHVRTYYDLAGNFTLVKVDNPIKAKFGVRTVVELSEQFAIIGEKIHFIQKPPLKGWDLSFPNMTELAPHNPVIIIYDKTISAVDLDGVRTLLDEEVNDVLVSPDGSLVALTGDNNTKVYRNDFSSLIATLDFHSKPIWIGSDGILEVHSSQDEIEATIYDLSGSSSTLYFDTDSVFYPEVDGLRVFTADAHNFFSKVPPFIADIFKLGSNSPSSVLLNCIDQLEQSSPRANENLSLINDLPAAISDCYNAATFEFDIRLQKKLLKAAHFGKTSMELYDSTGYLEALDIIRVANTLRGVDVSLFCTVAQIRRIGPKGLVSLLQKRKLWETALGVAKLFELPIETVPISWACSYIQESDEDDTIMQQNLDARLLKFPELSYVEVGRKAYDEGRLQLAQVLVAREPDPHKRVHLLMDMNEYVTALNQSVASGHIDLIYYALLVLHKKLSLSHFYRAIGDNEVAVRCYQRLLSSGRKDELHAFNYQMDRKEDDMKLQLDEIFVNPEPKLVASFQKQTRGYVQKSLGEYAKLLELQRQLQQDHGDTSFEKLTLTETIAKLLMNGQTSKAQKIAGSFGISDQQMWYTRIQVFIERRDWDGLWHLAQQRSPIGYKPFYEACKEAGNFEAAGKYVDMSGVNVEDKATMYLEIGQREQALEIAKNDEALLARISSE